MLDVRRLRLLHALAGYGTVAAVARALHLTGPAVSQQLAALEREAGVRLVSRTGRRLRLTDAGRLLVAHAEVVLGQLDAAEADLAALRTEVGGTVRMAAFPSAAATIVAAALRTLRAEHGTRVQVSLTELELDEARQALLRDEIDLAVVYAYDLTPWIAPAACEARRIMVDPVWIAVPVDDPLHDPRRPDAPIDLAGLADRPWVLSRAGTACHLMVQRACAVAGFAPRAVAQSADFSVILALVGAGLGVSLVPLLAAGQLPAGVALHPPAAGSLTRSVTVLTRHGPHRQPALRVVADHLAAAAGSTEPQKTQYPQ